MKRAIGIALAVLLLSAPAGAMEPDAADEAVKKALASDAYTFCKKPVAPLPAHARDLCPLAAEIPDCAGFAQACEHKKTERAFDWNLAWLAGLMSVLAKVLIGLVLIAIAALLIVPIVQAILRARRNKQASDPAPAEGVLEVPNEEPLAEAALVTDAERLLAQAEQALAQGQLDRALFLFLQAALRALDERGAIRIERSKTNGEYVRECRDTNAKQPLRELVREVDLVKWGGARADSGALARARERSVALVRAVLVTVAAFGLLGCGAAANFGRGGDPAEDGLLLEVLKSHSGQVSRLKASLATLPLPKQGALTPVVVVDAERVPLEDDARARMLSWVEAGGVLVLAGAPSSWPKELGAKPALGISREAHARDLLSPQEESLSSSGATETAQLARPTALAWPDAEGGSISRLADGPLYAAIYRRGAGRVLGLANDDLLTNAGLARPGNARALARILANLHRDTYEVARPQDGITPPSSPLAALVDAGLGKGLAHAAFAVLLTFTAFGVRQGRPRPTPRPARRAFAEHVEATGALYARTRLATHALAAYARYADAKVRAQMPRGANDPAAFLVQRTGADPARVADLWARATAAAHGQEVQSPLPTLRELSRVVSAALQR